MAMIIESGCWGCDGGPGPLLRVYRDPSGAMRQENLTDRLMATLPGSVIVGHAMTPDASMIAVAVCLMDGCHYPGLFNYDPDSVGVAYRSLDGGITWQEVARGGPIFDVTGILTDGAVLVGEAASGTAQMIYRVAPDNTPLTAPPGGTQPVGVGDRIVWRTNDSKLLNPDGSLFFQAPEGGESYFYGHPALSTGGAALTFWRLPMPLPRPDGYIDRWGIGHIEVGDTATLQRRWEIDGWLWSIGWWSYKDDRAVITLHVEGDPSILSPYPALVDLSTGTYNMIMAPFSTSQPGVSSLGRSVVHAVQTGPFARVTGTNSCLRVRAAPSLSGEVLACMADGVLLTDMEDTVDADGQTWARVMTPGGLQGWASAGYLER